MRWLARVLLGAAIVVQVGYEITTYSTGLHAFAWWYGAVATVCFAGLLAFDSRAFFGSLRICLGLCLGLAGVVQLGLLTHLVAIAEPLQQFVQAAGLAPKIGVLVPATLRHVLTSQTLSEASAACELVLGIGLILGVWSRFFSLMAGLLMLFFTAAIVVGEGITPVLDYALPVLCAGALVIAAEGSALGLDRRFNRKTAETDPFIFAFDEAQEKALRFQRASMRRNN
jgi:uncharacterized membrane protein YphA (DoxX/SURF4 family)